MNVGELLRERERLLYAIANNKKDKQRLRQVNILIAMYGDDEKVELEHEFNCDVEGCDRVFPTAHALGMHKARGHGIPSPSREAKRQREIRIRKNRRAA